MRSGGEPVEFRVFTAPSPQAPDAPTYLLLHGVGLSHRSFSRLAGWLAETGHVIALDLPGFGGTRHPHREIGIEDYATRIAALVSARTSARMIVVGHSMGAQLAAELAARHPRLVEAVVLIGPVPDRPTRVRLALRLARDSALEPPLTGLMVLLDYLRCGMTWFLTEVDAMVAYAMEPAVRASTVPVLVLRGEDDPIAKPEWCAHLASIALNGTALAIRGARHVAQHSQPEAVASAIADFATRIRGGRAA